MCYDNCIRLFEGSSIIWIFIVSDITHVANNAMSSLSIFNGKTNVRCHLYEHLAVGNFVQESQK